jgi:membrane-associated phospholipid phosphatase
VRAADAARATGTRPVDRLLGVYAVVAGGALLFPNDVPARGWLLALHAGAALLCFGLPPSRAIGRRLRAAAPAAFDLFRAWYPLALLPLMYTQLAVLNAAVHGGTYFDDRVIGWEQALFGGQPSRDLAAALPGLLLSETLHAAYLAFYPILYVPALAIWVRRSRADFELAVFTLLAVMTAHYVFFIYFPVQGPRYLFPPPTGPLENGFFHQLTHRLLEAGSSRGAAFPSSHVGGSVAVAIVALRLLPRLGIVLAVLALGVALGAVYGGFHYAIDALAGVVLALAVALPAPALFQWVARAKAPRVARAQPIRS